MFAMRFTKVKNQKVQGFKNSLLTSQTDVLRSKNL